jgi:hypothetical protein
MIHLDGSGRPWPDRSGFRPCEKRGLAGPRMRWARRAGNLRPRSGGPPIPSGSGRGGPSPLEPAGGPERPRASVNYSASQDLGPSLIYIPTMSKGPWRNKRDPALTAAIRKQSALERRRRRRDLKAAALTAAYEAAGLRIGPALTGRTPSHPQAYSKAEKAPPLGGVPKNPPKEAPPPRQAARLARSEREAVGKSRQRPRLCTGLPAAPAGGQ